MLPPHQPEYDAEGNCTKKTTGTTVSPYGLDQRDRLTGMTTKLSGSATLLAAYACHATKSNVALN
jgi:hypothetical protein